MPINPEIKLKSHCQSPALEDSVFQGLLVFTVDCNIAGKSTFFFYPFLLVYPTSVSSLHSFNSTAILQEPLFLCQDLSLCK